MRAAESVSFKSYKDLQVWQRGMDLVERIYELTRAFPQQEVYASPQPLDPSL